MAPKSFVLLLLKCMCSCLQLAGEQDLHNQAKTEVKKRCKIALNVGVRHFENTGPSVQLHQKLENRKKTKQMNMKGHH